MNEKANRETVLIGPVSQAGLTSVIKGALERRRRAIVVHMAHEIYAQLSGRAVMNAAEQLESGGWNSIHSLSQLRAIVGGRFKNLKDKWTGAGLPIRAHRGDRQERASVDPAGWAELADWIARQGFEARLSAGDEEFLFAVRRIGGAVPGVPEKD